MTQGNNPAVPKKNKIAEHFQKVGNRFMFEMGIELFYGDILEAFRDWLKPLTPERVKEMVMKGEVPEINPEWFTKIEGWRKYILTIKIGRVAQAIGDARPDLGMAILECGEGGGVWLNKVYVYLLECVDHPEKLIPAPPVEQTPGQEMVMARCQTCNKSWPVRKEDFSKIDKCPFCGTSAKAPPQVPPAATETTPAVGEKPVEQKQSKAEDKEDIAKN